MAKCCIKGCTSESCKNPDALSFFSFPENEDLYKTWIENIGEGNIIPSTTLQICSKHFELDLITETLGVVELIDGAVPTILPFTMSTVVVPSTALETEDLNFGSIEVLPERNGTTSVQVGPDGDEEMKSEEPTRNGTASVKIGTDGDEEIMRSQEPIDAPMDIADADTVDPSPDNEEEDDMSRLSEERLQRLESRRLAKLRRLSRKANVQKKKKKTIDRKCLRLLRKVRRLVRALEQLRKREDAEFPIDLLPSFFKRDRSRKG